MPLSEAVPGGTPGAGSPAEDRTNVRRLEFVEVRSTATTAGTTRRRGNVDAGAVAGAGTDHGSAGDIAVARGVVAATRADLSVGVSPGEPRWSLWGEGEGER